jgi:hypothetical protein
MRNKNFKNMKEVMRHINMIADEYRILSDQLNQNVIKTYSEFENKEELTQEQILSIAIDESDEIMFQAEYTNGPDFRFTEEEIDEIENIIVKSNLDQGFLVEQIKNIKSKQQELEKWLDYKKYRLKARDEKIHFNNQE